MADVAELIASMSTGLDKCRKIAVERVFRPRNIMAFIAVVAAGLTIAEMAIYPAQLLATTVLSVVHVACVLAMPWKPRPMAMAVAVTFMACCLLPDTGGSSLLFGTFLAVAVLGLYAKSWTGWLWPIVICVVRWTKFVADGIGVDGYATLLMVFVGLYAVGRTLSWRDAAGRAERDRLRYEQARQRLESMRRDQLAASRIHDAVTNNLAYMAMRLDYERSRETDTERIAMLDDLHRRAIDTLGEVRTVIDMLDGDDTGDGNVADGNGGRNFDRNSDENAANTDVNIGDNAAGDTVNTVDSARPDSFAERIRNEMTRGDQYLARLGFSGDSTLVDVRLLIDDPLPDGRAERLDEVVALLRELYTNIAVHGDRAGTYKVVVRRNVDTLIVDQVNDIATHSPLPDKPHSGKGLSLHRDRFATLGGTIHTSAEDGTWILHATMPLAKHAA
ncbi:hypothetical protein JS533_010125 [Bifidobacterium amazonense]|uniref:Histidine kinase n=1 Tax=Bifidobacterium amazonense TaxID=2809027 RepID=A0ABS9VXS5_9BIFI|nr:hypothetical protein [Bifidobacterium amazonense]MCH9276620.1 hypothetical protein [Bifidobacterium amazonense]